MISYLRYEGDTLEDSIISQGDTLPMIAKDKELFIDTSENVLKRYDSTTSEWKSVGAATTGTELTDGAIIKTLKVNNKLNIDNGGLFLKSKNANTGIVLSIHESMVKDVSYNIILQSSRVK